MVVYIPGGPKSANRNDNRSLESLTPNGSRLDYDLSPAREGQEDCKLLQPVKTIERGINKSKRTKMKILISLVSL